ncbi:MAG: hypothetical protein ABSE73_16170 [Planctomycetota bacterium]
MGRTGVIALALLATLVRAENDMLDPDNLKALGCAAPDTNCVVVATSQPGAIFYPGEPVKMTVKVTRKDTPLESVTFALQEVSTRQGRLYDKPMGWSMTPPVALDVLRQCGSITAAVKTEDQPGATAQLDVELPTPETYGCYVITIAPNGKDPQFLCSLLRAIKPVAGFHTDVPMMAEGASFLEGGKDEKSRKDPDAQRARLAILTRLGVKVVRWEFGGMRGMKQDGAMDWKDLDLPFQLLEEAQLKLCVTLGAVPYWAMPFSGPTPAISPAMQDHTPDPKYLEAYGNWVEAFCRRFWKNGTGTLWAIECWNEPWETEDKFLTGEDRAEWMQRIDAISDHYVMPPNNYGAMVARKWGKEVFETETWGASTEMLMYQFVTQFLACGDTMINPMQAPMMCYNTPGHPDEYRFPKPAALAANALNFFLTGRPFQRMLFLQHVPFAFQFGKDPDAVVILLGRLRPNLSAFGGGNRDSLWWQLNLRQGGTITIDNPDGKLEFYDMAGNRAFQDRQAVTLPLDLQAHYIRAPKDGMALIEARLKAARIEGLRPVEIIAHDFGAPVDSGAAQVRVTVHNLLNRPATGALRLAPPEGFALASNLVQVQLGAGETKDFTVAITKGVPSPVNMYELSYDFASDCGLADWKETLHVLLAKKSTKTIDGNLDDWNDDYGVLVRSTGQKVDATLQAWQPFNKFAELQPDGSFAELKAAWDDRFFYIAARVNSPAAGPGHIRVAKWDENKYFHSAEDDAFCEALQQYEEFFRNDLKNADNVKRLEKDPKWPEFQKLLQDRPEVQEAINSGMLGFYFQHKQAKRPISWASAPHVYKKDFFPDGPLGGDLLQVAFDVIPGYAHQELASDVDHLPEGFHCMPDTDYEYSAYLCSDGGAELWRLLAPGVPRGHYMPRQARSKIDQGPVEGGQCVVKRNGKITSYELAIPWSELKEWHPQAGQTFGFTFKVNSSKGPALFFGENKSATKTNGLTLHPYWEGKPSCGVRWTLGK